MVWNYEQAMSNIRLDSCNACAVVAEGLIECLNYHGVRSSWYKDKKGTIFYLLSTLQYSQNNLKNMNLQYCERIVKEAIDWNCKGLTDKLERLQDLIDEDNEEPHNYINNWIKEL
jgi:hypothetical protein